jgi:succinyl-diaminopimelate desuccinylase
VVKQDDILNVLNRVEQLERDGVQYLQDMIRARSENPPGEYEAVVGAVKPIMENLGIQTEVVSCAPWNEFETLLDMEEMAPEWRKWLEENDVPPELSSDKTLSEKLNIVGRIRGSGPGPTLMMNAHMDTVPAGEGWSVDPFEGIVRDGKLYGRGACDNKGGIAAALVAARALRESGVDFRGEILLVFTAEEEVGSHSGAAFLVKKGVVQADACLCADGPADSMVTSFNGFIPFIVTVRGRSVHGTHPSHGVNAIQKMMRVQAIFADVEKRLGTQKSRYPTPPDTGEEYTSVVPTTINGGTRFYIVPDRCSSWIDVHVIPDQDPAEVRGMIEQEIRKEQESDLDLQIDIKVPLMARPAMVDPESAIVRTTQAAARHVLGNELPMYRMVGLTDARFFLAAGIPTVTHGPHRIDACYHAADEWVRIDDLTNLSKVYALTALNFLNGDTP